MRSERYGTIYQCKLNRVINKNTKICIDKYKIFMKQINKAPILQMFKKLETTYTTKIKALYKTYKRCL